MDKGQWVHQPVSQRLTLVPESSGFVELVHLLLIRSHSSLSCTGFMQNASSYSGIDVFKLVSLDVLHKPQRHYYWGTNCIRSADHTGLTNSIIFRFPYHLRVPTDHASSIRSNDRINVDRLDDLVMPSNFHCAAIWWQPSINRSYCATVNVNVNVRSSLISLRFLHDSQPTCREPTEPTRTNRIVR